LFEKKIDKSGKKGTCACIPAVVGLIVMRMIIEN